MSRPRWLGTQVLQLLVLKSESIPETQYSDSQNTDGLLLSKFKRVPNTFLIPVITFVVWSIHYSPEIELSTA